MLLPVIASTCFGYHCQEHSLIFFEVCIGAHGLTLTLQIALAHVKKNSGRKMTTVLYSLAAALTGYSL